MNTEKEAQTTAENACTAYASPRVEVIAVETQGIIAGSLKDYDEEPWEN